MTIPMLLTLFPPVFSHGHLLLIALFWYGLAKVTEVADKAIFRMTRGNCVSFPLYFYKQLKVNCYLIHVHRCGEWSHSEALNLLPDHVVVCVSDCRA